MKTRGTAPISHLHTDSSNKALFSLRFFVNFGRLRLVNFVPVFVGEEDREKLEPGKGTFENVLENFIWVVG